MRSMLVCAAALMAAAVNASASGLGDPFAGLSGLPLGAEEAAQIAGGDVKMTLNAERNSLRVEVSAQKDRRTGHKKAGSERSYEIEAHNRVADTNKADYMPADGSDGGKLKTKPERFPEGSWKVTGVRERKDKYGPNIVDTDAVGEVEAFDASGASVGRRKDRGYAIHSNSRPFNESRSWGCIVVKEEDNRRLAGTLRRDIEQWGKGRQTLKVERERER